jgi:serine palmitoyltransferase
LFRSILSKIEPSPLPGTQAQDKDAIISIPSHPSSALIHIFLLNPPETMNEEEKLLQRVVDECIENGILVTRARRLRGQEAFEPEPSLKVCLSSALGRKDVEKAGQVVKAALIKVCGSESILPLVWVAADFLEKR